MNRAEQTGQTYVLGHSDRELARLERQAAFFADITRQLLVQAGLRPGMKVLDVGCGVGDVSLIAADLVGAEGSIHGIDISPDALSIAAARAQANGRGNVSFSASSIDTFENYAAYDAVIGRFILVHMPDASSVVRVIAERVRPGAIVSFIEMDMSTATALPALPLLSQCIQWVLEVYKRAGRQCDAGAALYSTFRAAGLDPELAGMTRVGNSRELDGFAFISESIRSLLPFLEKLQIASAEEIGMDTLQDRLIAEAISGDHCILYPRIIGGWAVKP